MNIVIATWSYWPNSDGVQMVSQYQAEGLVKRGHKVSVLVKRSTDRMTEECVHNGVAIYSFCYKAFMRYEYGQKSKFQKKLLELTETADVFMAVGGQAFAFTWSCKILDRIPCRKVLFMHGMREPHINWKKLHDVKHLWKELLLTPYYNLFFKRHWKQMMKYDACCHLFKNDASYNYFVEHGFQHNFVIMNACEEALFKEELQCDLDDAVRRYEIGRPYFVQVANYAKRKNQKEAVNAYYHMESNRCTLVCIGSQKNAYMRELMDLNDKLAGEHPEKEKAHILLEVPREDTVKLIKASYASLMTSQNEYFPITIAESLAAGKPYISSNVGNVPMLPGGNVYHDLYELHYWLDYYVGHEAYVKMLGTIGKLYADENMHTDKKVGELERVLSGF